VHRFDMDAKYAYISTEMDGYLGNILVIYDLRDPAKPQEVSAGGCRAAHRGGEQATWRGRRNRLHHALRSAMSCGRLRHAGVRVIDIADLRRPRTVGEYNYHPPFPEPRIPSCRSRSRSAAAYRGSDRRGGPCPQRDEMARRKGRPHGCLWSSTSPIFEDQPAVAVRGERARLAWSRATPGASARISSRSIARHAGLCSWFSAACASSTSPTRSRRRKSSLHPEPAAGTACPQTNDVDVDSRGWCTSSTVHRLRHPRITPP